MNRSRVVTDPKRPIYLYARATCSELPSLLSTTGWRSYNKGLRANMAIFSSYLITKHVAHWISEELKLIIVDLTLIVFRGGGHIEPCDTKIREECLCSHHNNPPLIV